MKGCLSDDALIAMCFGEADAAVQAHLRECLACAARYRAAARDMEMVAAILRERSAWLPARRTGRPRRAATVVGAGLALLAAATAAWMAPWWPDAGRPLSGDGATGVAVARAPLPASAPAGAVVDAETVAFLDQVSTALSGAEDMTAPIPLLGEPAPGVEDQG